MTLFLDKKLDNPKTTVFLSLLSVLCGAVCSVFGVIGYLFMPLLSALLSLIYTVDKTKWRLLSVFISLAVLTVDGLIAAFITGMSSFSSAIAVLVALCMALSLTLRKNKSLGVAFGTVSVAVGFLIYIFVICSAVASSYGYSDTFDYLRYLVDFLRDEFVEIAIQALSSEEEAGAVSVQLLVDSYNFFISSIVAYIVSFAFILVGVAHKIFSKLCLVFLENKRLIIAYRFVPNVVFAYFFLISNVICFFASSTDAFIITLYNLVIIFRLVYAYIGFRIAKAYLGTRISNLFVIFFVFVVAAVAFSAALIELLSIIGSVLCIAASWRKRSLGGDDGEEIKG